MNRQIRVFMRYIHEYLAHIQRDRQFLLSFSNERLFLGFAWLYLAAHKLPQQPSGLAGRALANHKFVLIPNQGCDYFGNTFLTHVNNSLYSFLTLSGFYIYSPLEYLLSFLQHLV